MRQDRDTRYRRERAGRGARTSLALLLGMLIPGTAGSEARSEDQAAAFFKANCTTCHTIGGGRLTGPDLKDVTGRKDREWLHSFILNPQAKITAGDPYALELVSGARGVVMPQPPGITPGLADALLDLIEAESALPESQFKGAQISLAPFTPADAERGLAIFSGRQPLANRGTACGSCHSVPGLRGLGGGALGPDLTRVFERLGGRQAISSWLQSPATPTMRAAFRETPLRPDEIHALTALFDSTATRPTATDPAVGQFSFLLWGLGGAVLILALLDFLWRGRLQLVRKALVEASNN